MNNKTSITWKLFIITAFVFAVFIGGTLIAQSLFFEKFYIDKKENDIKNYVERIKINYLNPDPDKNLDDLIDEISETANMKVVIIDSNGKIKFTSRPIKSRFDVTNSRVLTEYIRRWLERSYNRTYIKQQNNTVTTIFKFGPRHERFLIGAAPVNEKNEIIFGLTSLQPVNEATSVIGKFYLYFSVGALLIILLLSFIYSNLIAKPLVRINKTATKMAHLDFSEKCDVVSNDEIGNVAASLNFLSENLNNALTSLKTANAELEKDIEKERNLERMRKEFVASVSHELKTPISLIDGYAAGLKDNIFEGKEKDFYLDIIMDEAKKMGHLVSDMMDLSQLESGNFKLAREEFVLTDLIRFTLKKYEALIGEKPATVETNLIDGIRVNADWNRLEQVMTNFVTNALRHVTENGTIAVNMIDKGDGISVEVENTGSNIPGEELEKIWDKFYKVDKSGSKKLSGTGIGLSIVKNILMLHNYPFGVENTEGGVKFYFVVPKESHVVVCSNVNI